MYTLKAAKEWFIAHPRSKVVYHRRWNDLPSASREVLETPREAKVIGRRVVFTPQSELSLMTENGTSSVTPGGLLDIFDGDGRIIVTYAPA
jgi:hypothetical protein